jgi:serine/threonine protein kinase
MSDSLENSRTEALSASPPDLQGTACGPTTDGRDHSALPATHPGPDAIPATLKRGHFGEYELLQEVARGGMGVVYKARQRSLDRIVALKMILEGQLASEESVRRFHQEARSAAALDHPCIVPIYEIGQFDGHHFFTMAFIEGTTLSAQVREQGVPPPREAAALLLRLADAVEYAHRRGVLHRDLKPENVLVDQDGRPRITDFGLAKSMGNASGLTSAGRIMGTPGYMAPEQAWGRLHQMGPATDVYALGGILYFMLTGRAPFEGASTMEVLSQVTNRPPTSPRQLVPAIPADLEAICLKCLEKEPPDRYASAGDLVAALRASSVLEGGPMSLGDFATPSVSGLTPTVLETPPVGEAPTSATVATSSIPPPPRRRGGRLVALAAVAVIVGIAGALLIRHLLQTPDQDHKPAALFVEPVRHDFEVKVEIVGATPGENGEWRLFAGRPVQFAIEVDRDAYVGLWNIATDGTIMQMFPSRFEHDNFVKAGKRRVVPADNYLIDAVLSKDVERVWVMASTARWDVDQGEEQGPFALSLEQQQKLATTTREFRLVPKTKDGPRLSEAAMRYRVVPAPSAGKR